jgi:hypothetical protein
LGRTFRSRAQRAIAASTFGCISGGNVAVKSVVSSSGPAAAASRVSAFRRDSIDCQPALTWSASAFRASGDFTARSANSSWTLLPPNVIFPSWKSGIHRDFRSFATSQSAWSRNRSIGLSRTRIATSMARGSGISLRARTASMRTRGCSSATWASRSAIASGIRDDQRAVVRVAAARALKSSREAAP